MSRAPRVLLISPKFHGYWESISRALTSLGHDVVPYIYDDFSNARSKARNKLTYELPGRLGSEKGHQRFSQDATAAARDAVRDCRPDLAFVIKADVLESSLWEDITAQGIPMVLWLYDELRRTEYDLTDLQHFSAVASYSAIDAQTMSASGLRAIHLPLAFDPDLTSRTTTTDDVVFIGARYPERERQLQLLHDAGIAVRAYGRDWSHHPWDRIRTWDVRRPSLPGSREISRPDGYALMAGAPATLNVHGDQDGFTMRTFEVPGMGGLELIDRVDVDKLYEPGVEVVPYQSDDELIELCRRSISDPKWRNAIAEAGRNRTMAEHTFAHRVKKLVELWD